MKKGYILSILMLVAGFLYGQNDPLFSHYMFNSVAYNPAAIGAEQVAGITFQHRSQWLGYNSTFDGDGGAPSTQLLSLTVPLQSKISGVGLVAINDNLGPVGNFVVSLPISYNLQALGGSLSVAVNPGLFSQTQKFDELRFNDPSDPLNIGSRETQLKPNLGAGLFYTSSQSFYIGLSAQNMLQPSFDFGLDSLQNELSTTLYGSGGFSQQITADLAINPSVLVRSDLNTLTFDISAILDYKNLAWGGVSFRRSEAVVFLIGYSFLENRELKVGYSIDYIIDEQRAKQPTSHEFLITYDLPNLVFGGRKQVKTPRYTY